LKKEEWSVYVLDQSASDRKFCGNGTINSVLNDDEPVPIVGKVKKKFRKELLDIELRFVKVVLMQSKRLILGTNISCEEAAHIITRTVISVRVATTLLSPTALFARPPTTIISNSTGLRSPSSNPPTKYVFTVHFSTTHRPIVD
jgi:hypothetical protein